MKFTKRTYLAQVITYGIFLFLLSSIILFTAGLFAFIKLGTINNEKALDYAILLVLMIIASAIALGFIVLTLFQFITSIKLYKASKISATHFMTKQKSRKVNTIFGILTIIAGIIVSLLVQPLLLSIIVSLIPISTTFFLILNRIAMKKIKLEISNETKPTPSSF